MNSSYKTLIVLGIFLIIVSGGYLILRTPSTTPESESHPQSEQNKNPEEQPMPEPLPANEPTSPPSSEKPLTTSPTGGTFTPPPASSQKPSSSSQTQRTSRLLLTITDDAVAITDIDSIFMSTTNIEARNANNQWISVTDQLRTYDLLKLKRESKMELMLDTIIPEGTYNQLRIKIESVVVIKNGLANTVRLPSNTVILPFSLPLRTGQTAALMLDIQADKSLHISADNQYIFAPVIHMDALGEIQIVQKSSSKVEFFGGLPKYAASFGMIETGAMQQNSLGIDSLSRIEIENNVFILTPHSLDRSIFTVTPGSAMETAKNSAYLTQITAVYATLLEKRPTWRISGTLNGRSINVYVDGINGSMVKAE